MDFYISYFYQLRFFPKNAVPLSTCLYDPKYYHDSKGAAHVYYDKRGVINGLRAEPLCPKEVHVIGEAQCGKNCGQQIPCLFMKEYYKYLQTLDFNDIISRAETLAKKIDDNPIIILLVHEPKSCKCAERPCLQKWFADHGIELKEWEKNDT